MTVHMYVCQILDIVIITTIAGRGEVNVEVEGDIIETFGWRMKMSDEGN